MKTFLYILLVIVLIGGGVLLFNNYANNTPSENGEVSELAQYFQERMTTLAVEDIGQPIEGFDAQLLMMAYPGIMEVDFVNVASPEGHYEIKEGELVFVRDQKQPITSAERTISSQGYDTLLGNLSGRLKMPATSETDIDALIEMVNTREQIETWIDQGAMVFGIKIIPQELLEDSRCPIDAECIQAGTVRVSTQVEQGGEMHERTFELQEPEMIGGQEVTLVRVDPPQQTGQTIDEGQYVFIFEVNK